MRVLAAEVLWMRAQCPPTEEVEKLRAGANEANSLGLHLINIGAALREAGQPHRYKGDEIERIRDLAGERDSLRNAEFRGQNGRVFRLSSAEWESGDADGMPSSVGIFGSGDMGRGEVAYYERAAGGALTDEARTAIAAMRDLGPELAKAGIQVGPRCSHAEAVAQLRGERDRWREKCDEAEWDKADAARWGIHTAEKLAAAGFALREPKEPGLYAAVERALAELGRLRKESKRDQVAKQQAIIDEIARLFPGTGPLLERVHKGAALAKIGADVNNGKPAPSPWRERFMRLRDSIKVQLAWCGHSDGVPYDGMHKEHAVLSCALRNADALIAEAAGGVSMATGGVVDPDPSVMQPDDGDYLPKVGSGADPFGLFTPRACQEPKVGPATGKPRTEAPVGPDGSGTLVELGEAFHRAMDLASPSPAYLRDQRPGESFSDTRMRNLHAAVAELAKVVERIGGASEWLRSPTGRGGTTEADPMASDPLTPEAIAELRKMHGEAVTCRAQFEGRITARMAGVFVDRLPALLDAAERCAAAEARCTSTR